MLVRNHVLLGNILIHSWHSVTRHNLVMIFSKYGTEILNGWPISGQCVLMSVCDWLGGWRCVWRWVKVGCQDVGEVT